MLSACGLKVCSWRCDERVTFKERDLPSAVVFDGTWQVPLLAWRVTASRRIPDRLIILHLLSRLPSECGEYGRLPSFR